MRDEAMIPSSNDVRIEVCTACNYDCTICCRDLFTRKIEVMESAFFKEVLEKIQKDTDQYSLVTFAGFGEPLMDPAFVEKVAIARDLGFETTVLTNAYKLTPELFEKLDRLGMQSVRISFYGMDEESYNRVHRAPVGSFKRVSDNLKAICAMERKTKVLMTLNVVDGCNDADVKKWIDHWEPQADLVEVWRPHNWVDGHDFRELTVEKRPTCGRPFTGPLQVQVDGTVNMCCFDFDGKLLLGDLRQQSLEEVFSSEPFKALEHCHKTGDYSGTGYICEQCDQRNVSKSDVMLYNSKFSIDERVEMTSSGYAKLADGDAGAELGNSQAGGEN